MDNSKQSIAVWVVAGVLLASFVPLSMSVAASAQSAVTIDGAGATFPFPLIDTWRVEYQTVKPNVNLNYQSIGSGGGIRQFTERTVDFGATDAPLNSNQTAALPGIAVHIPETIGSVVAAYNVLGIQDKGLKLTGPILAEIFMGDITKWDDPKIKELNPDAPVPNADIVVVHRSDGSGTTFVWTDYLSKVSQEWNSTVGRGTAVEWPTGLGAPGNEGVASGVKGTMNTIGYVELAYELTTEMDYAFIENQEGEFIEPSLASTSAAVVASARTLPKGDGSWSGVSLTNAPGAQSYPIASFSYLLLYKELSTNSRIDSMEKAKALVEFVDWAITDGQGFAEELQYVPLPEQIVTLDKETLASLTFNGQPILEAEPTPTEEPFTVSSSLDGDSYTITGAGADAKATGFTIDPQKSIQLQVEGTGEIELTLPKTIISGIPEQGGVMAGGEAVEYEIVDETGTDTVVRIKVPEGESELEIMGTFVVPEFGVVAVMILAAAIVGMVGLSRRKGSPLGMGFGKQN